MALNLLRTKTPEHLMAEAAAPERQLKRDLSAFDLTCIGIGAIIGAGIFALAGTAAAGDIPIAARLAPTSIPRPENGDVSDRRHHWPKKSCQEVG
jgi:hypothetical protein